MSDELHERRIIDFIVYCNSRRDAILFLRAISTRFHRLRYNTTCTRTHADIRIYIYANTHGYIVKIHARLLYYIILFNIRGRYTKLFILESLYVFSARRYLISAPNWSFIGAEDLFLRVPLLLTPFAWSCIEANSYDAIIRTSILIILHTSEIFAKKMLN